MQVDLHIHSTASDGTWTPPEVVAAALAAGLGAIAVTDHDSVANVAATHELAVAAGLKFIPGAEICSTKDDFCFHILGYGIDVTNKRLLDLLEHNERLLNSKDDESIKMLIERGWPLDFEEFLRYDYDRRRGGWKALAFLQDKGLCGDVNDFFSRIFTKEHDLGFPVFPSIKEVVDAIHAAGGVALCARMQPAVFMGRGWQRHCWNWRRRILMGLNVTIRDTAGKILRHCSLIAVSISFLSAAAATATAVLCRHVRWAGLLSTAAT